MRAAQIESRPNSVRYHGLPAATNWSVGGPGQCLLLGADTSLMPAAARLCLPGADAPTYAHAVGLLQMLCDRGIATDWTTACRVVGELPVALLHEYTEAIDANLVTSTESSRRGLAGAGA